MVKKAIKCARCDKWATEWLFWGWRKYCLPCYSNDRAIAGKVREFLANPPAGECRQGPRVRQ